MTEGDSADTDRVDEVAGVKLRSDARRREEWRFRWRNRRRRR